MDRVPRRGLPARIPLVASVQQQREVTAQLQLRHPSTNANMVPQKRTPPMFVDRAAKGRIESIPLGNQLVDIRPDVVEREDVSYPGTFDRLARRRLSGLGELDRAFHAQNREQA